MKKKKAVWFALMLCWWGLLFPELTFTEDSLRVVYTKECEGKLGAEADIEQSRWETYVDFLNAQPQQVKVKSKLFELLKGLWE